MGADVITAAPWAAAAISAIGAVISVWQRITEGRSLRLNSMKHAADMISSEDEITNVAGIDLLMTALGVDRDESIFFAASVLQTFLNIRTASELDKLARKSTEDKPRKSSSAEKAAFQAFGRMRNSDSRVWPRGAGRNSDELYIGHFMLWIAHFRYGNYSATDISRVAARRVTFTRCSFEDAKFDEWDLFQGKRPNDRFALTFEDCDLVNFSITATNVNKRLEQDFSTLVRVKDCRIRNFTINGRQYDTDRKSGELVKLRG